MVCVEVRRAIIARDKAQQVRAALRRTPLTLHPMTDLLDAGVEASLATGKALYDCLSLALATSLNARFITADRRFAAGLGNTPLARRVSVLEGV